MNFNSYKLKQKFKQSLKNTTFDSKYFLKIDCFIFKCLLLVLLNYLNGILNR